ncbi:MAG: HNH endonuclease [Sedimentisphaerales bacterium]|nr:HNH endonuclease [Sedimentisphaerales bacterium]
MSEPRKEPKPQMQSDDKSGREKKRPGRPRKRKPPQVPPPDSTIWPEQYRGKNWKRVYAFLFEGHCQLCAYSCPLSKWRQQRDKLHGEPRLLLCTNHPDSPGELHEVLPIETCRNFKKKVWQHSHQKPAPDSSPSVADECDSNVRRIPLGNGLFATVDAADYEKVSRYKWRAYRTGRRTYATCKNKGKFIYMHHMILRPRKGYVVDHIDGNGLNNQRCNLRECTRAQNLANARPRGGASQFIGVYRYRDKWQAGITCRGQAFNLGIFDDEVEAPKARDRKAYELHGEYAYLDFPEDFGR